MQRDGQTGFLDRRLHHVIQISMMRIFARRAGHLQNDGGIEFLTSFDDTLHDFHVVHVESTNGVTAFIGFLEHLFCVNEGHTFNLLKNFNCIFSIHHFSANRKRGASINNPFPARESCENCRLLPQLFCVATAIVKNVLLGDTGIRTKISRCQPFK